LTGDSGTKRHVPTAATTIDLVGLTGTDHIVIKTGDQTYFIPYNAIVAVRPPL